MTSFTIRFPTKQDSLPSQEEYFYLLTETGQERLLRIHDYAQVYQIPGLYEHIVCEKLQYQAPQVIAELLVEQAEKDNITVNDFVVLDIGAGNGISGQALANLGINSIVGLDIIPEAAKATQRDYPGVYQQYYIEDLTCLRENTHQALKSQNFNVLLMSGSLYHLPAKAFYNALNLIPIGGWFAVTLRTSVIESEKSGNAIYLFEQLVSNKTLKIITQKTYQQRLSINEQPIMGLAIIGKKQASVPASLIKV